MRPLELHRAALAFTACLFSPDPPQRVVDRGSALQVRARTNSLTVKHASIFEHPARYL